MNGDHHRMCLLNKNLGMEVFFDSLNCSVLIVEKYCFCSGLHLNFIVFF